jgi:hypothetical protein
MRGFLGICLFGSLLVFKASAVTVAEKWTRQFTNLGIVLIFPDNRGNLAVAANDGNSAIAILLDERGRLLRQGVAPMPTVSKAEADSLGRIYFAAGGQSNGLPVAYAITFDPFFASIHWSTNYPLFPFPNSRINGYGTDILALNPKPDGNLQLWATWNGFYGPQYSIVDFSDRGVAQAYLGSTLTTRSFVWAAVARSPDGGTFLAATRIDLHYPQVIVSRFSPEGALVWRISTGGLDFATDAACDHDGNLVLTGSTTTDRESQYRRRTGMTMKINPWGQTLWKTANGPLSGGYDYARNRKVVVSRLNEIIVTGYDGTLKYSPLGQQLWSIPLSMELNQLLIDSHGNIVFADASAKPNGLYGLAVTKLTSDGATLWKIQSKGSNETDDYFAALTVDSEDDIYLAINSSSGAASVTKYVQHGKESEGSEPIPISVQPLPRTNHWRGVLSNEFAGQCDLAPLVLFDGTNVYFYNVAFDSPPQIVGQTVVTGLGPNTPSEILFGEPFVVDSYSASTNQPLVLVPWTGYHQIGFELAKQAPNYFVEFDLVIHWLAGSSFAFDVFFDGAGYLDTVFHGGIGSVYSFSPAGDNSTLLPSWTEDEPHHVRIDVDLLNRKRRFAFDNEPVFEAPLLIDLMDVNRVRFNAGWWTGNEVKPIWPVIAVDNIRVGTTALPVAPVVSCSGPTTLECSNGSVATICANVTDFGGRAMEVLWSVDGVVVQTNQVASGVISSNLTLAAELGEGVHAINVTVSNGMPLTATCSTTVTVLDTLPPEIHNLFPVPASLWPPDDTLKLVSIIPDVIDLCNSARCRIISVESGDAGTNDMQIVGDLAVRLRAERSRTHSNRVYTVTVECMDSNGNKSRGTTFIPVSRVATQNPH